jgi:hypothetical protein
MEILVFILLGSILGICVGNTSIRNKIGEEIHTIITKERPQKHTVDCPIKEKPKYKATYVSKERTENKGSEIKSKSVCNECGNPIEIIDKMPGFFFCDNCKKVVDIKKEGVGK